MIYITEENTEHKLSSWTLEMSKETTMNCAEGDFGRNDTLVVYGVKSTWKSEYTSAVCVATAGSLPAAPEQQHDILSNPRLLPTPALTLQERDEQQKKMPNEERFMWVQKAAWGTSWFFNIILSN